MEKPYIPFYKPYGMTDEEYRHEVRIAEEKHAEWEEQQRLNDAIEQTKCTYDRKCEFKENGKCSIPFEPCQYREVSG